MSQDVHLMPKISENQKHIFGQNEYIFDWDEVSEEEDLKSFITQYVFQESTSIACAALALVIAEDFTFTLPFLPTLKPRLLFFFEEST